MQRLPDSSHVRCVQSTPSPLSIAGTFGRVALGVSDRALVLQTIGRNYDTTGFLHVDAAQVRLPINDAIRLHKMLADAITAAEQQPDTRQTALWSDAMTVRRAAA
jgi:hypothetical protein